MQGKHQREGVRGVDAHYPSEGKYFFTNCIFVVSVYLVYLFCHLFRYVFLHLFTVGFVDSFTFSGYPFQRPSGQSVHHHHTFQPLKGRYWEISKKSLFYREKWLQPGRLMSFNLNSLFQILNSKVSICTLHIHV